MKPKQPLLSAETDNRVLEESIASEIEEILSSTSFEVDHTFEGNSNSTTMPNGFFDLMVKMHGNSGVIVLGYADDNPANVDNRMSAYVKMVAKEIHHSSIELGDIIVNKVCVADVPNIVGDVAWTLNKSLTYSDIVDNKTPDSECVGLIFFSIEGVDMAKSNKVLSSNMTNKKGVLARESNDVNDLYKILGDNEPDEELSVDKGIDYDEFMDQYGYDGVASNFEMQVKDHDAGDEEDDCLANIFANTDSSEAEVDAFCEVIEKGKLLLTITVSGIDTSSIAVDEVCEQFNTEPFVSPDGRLVCRDVMGRRDDNEKYFVPSEITGKNDFECDAFGSIDSVDADIEEDTLTIEVLFSVSFENVEIVGEDSTEEYDEEIDDADEEDVDEAFEDEEE